MEKLRRKRINNSLEQLRTLLPHSVNLKRDMASLLEQTVEYINIMHTVLNEDKPECLNKVYVTYREKTEEIESFRVRFKKTISKRAKSEPGCSWPQQFQHSYGGQIAPNLSSESYMKHGCIAPLYYDQFASQVPWQQRKRMPDTFLHGQQQQPCFSGENVPMSQHSAIPRAMYFPSPNMLTKQFGIPMVSDIQGSSTCSGQSQHCSIDPLTKMELLHPITPTHKEPLYYEDSNSSSVCHEDIVESSLPKPELTEMKGRRSTTPASTMTDVPIEVKLEGNGSNNVGSGIANVAMAAGVLKQCGSPKSGVPSPPEIYFADSSGSQATNNIAGENPYSSLCSWMRTPSTLPPLSLSQNFVLTSSQQQAYGGTVESIGILHMSRTTSLDKRTPI